MEKDDISVELNYGRYACPRCANRTLEEREDPYGNKAFWCSICFTAWAICHDGWSNIQSSKESANK